MVDAEITQGLTRAFPGAEIRTGTEWTLTDAPYRVVVGGPEGANPTDLVEVARRAGQTIDAALVQVAGRRDHESASNPIQENKPHA